MERKRRVEFTPVMMSRVARVAGNAGKVAKNSPVVKQARVVGRNVLEGVAEEFGKRQLKEAGKDALKKGKQLLKKTPDRGGPKTPGLRNRRFWMTDSNEDDGGETRQNPMMKDRLSTIHDSLLDGEDSE